LIPHNEFITGKEKEEYERLQAGEKDPFEMEPLRGPFGTADHPAVVNSVFDERIVGCTGISHNYCLLLTRVGGKGDAEHDLNWFILKKDNPRCCCECGQVFVLNKVEETHAH